MMICFMIPGKPVPKARARVMRGGWTYTPKRTLQFEKMVKLTALAARQAIKLSISGGSFRLLVFCYGADPRSDWDNLGKAISDALNGVFWEDDRQVIDAHVMKLPCAKGQERTEISLEPLPDLSDTSQSAPVEPCAEPSSAVLRLPVSPGEQAA